jgi:uncharacterized repeat protein (TIGR03803 family)
MKSICGESMNPLRPLVAVLVASLSSVASAQNTTPVITDIFAFPCNASFVCPDGYFPVSLIEGADGSFYGAAVGGGVGLNAQGTIFKITPTGQISVIYSFAESSNGSLPNGSAPGSLVEGTDGFLYGTTSENGANGFGTVFKLSKSGAIQTLHNFCGTENCSDGANPGFLMQALDGNFYGDTGPTDPPTSVLYRMSPVGGFKVLHTFDTKSQPDGTGVYGMVQAADGNLYGTTVAGEQFKPYNSVFRFDPASGQYTILHGFNTPNINLPGVATSAPALTSTGELFGLQAGSELYEISLAGKYQKIGGLSTTDFFDGNILQASDGNLWGDFTGGDCSGQSIVFAATTAGSVLQDLTLDCTTIGEQAGAMLQAADGKFYGVTYGNGGVSSTDFVTNGTIWSIDAGLPAPAPCVVEFRPSTGTVGAEILLQGNHFVGTTAVSVNGVSATFRVLSVNYLNLTVPAGATTGPIAVTNAGGTTTSTQVFTVE